jgi:hypothetical protein
VRNLTPPIPSTPQVPRRIRVQISRRRNDDEDAAVRHPPHTSLYGRERETRLRTGRASAFARHGLGRVRHMIRCCFRGARCLWSHADLRHPPPSLARSVSQEEMYSYVTVADAPEGFSGLGTTVVDDV